MEQEKSALIVIDLQNDFTLKNGKAHACTSQADITIPKINELIKSFENKYIEVVYFKTEWKSLIIKLLTKNSVKPGSHGAELDKRLTSLKKTYLLRIIKIFFLTGNLWNFLKKIILINYIYLDLQ
nr:isochorismatase family protein [uncultured Paraglaciecola sp.]